MIFIIILVMIFIYLSYQLLGSKNEATFLDPGVSGQNFQI